jgi:hypothetical protein
MPGVQDLLKEALALKALDRARLIDGLMCSLDEPDPKIEEIWSRECVKRYEAFKAGRITSKPVDEVLRKYE